MRMKGPVLPRGMQVSAQLPADRRRGTSEQPADRRRAMTAAGEVGDLDALLLGQEPGRDAAQGERLEWGGTTLTVPSFNRTVVPLFQMRPVERPMPSSIHAARNGHALREQLEKLAPLQRHRSTTRALQNTTRRHGRTPFEWSLWLLSLESTCLKSEHSTIGE